MMNEAYRACSKIHLIGSHFTDQRNNMPITTNPSTLMDEIYNMPRNEKQNLKPINECIEYL